MHHGPTNANRATPATLSCAVAVVIPWLSQAMAGVAMPAEVAAALGVLILAVVNVVWSRFGGIGGGNQAGFVLPGQLLAILAIAALGMAGCTTSPVHRAPANTYESLMVANAYGEQITATVNDLRRAQILTSEQHHMALDRLQVALDASRAARIAFQAGDEIIAAQGLARVELALMMVAEFLAPYLPDDAPSHSFYHRYGDAR